MTLGLWCIFTHNKCIHSCYWPCNYVTKPFGKLWRVIKIQMVPRSFEHSKNQYLPPQKNLWPNFKTGFSIFRSHEKVITWKNILTIPMCFFEEKMFRLCRFEEISPDFQLYMETFSYFIRWFLFLILTFYKETKQDTKNWSEKCWSSRLVLLFYSCLLQKETELYDQI